MGARKMLFEVKRNFPAVDNISGMIAVCDILFSAGLRFMDVDIYFVLQIPPEATSSEIKSKYKFTTFRTYFKQLSWYCISLENRPRCIFSALTLREAQNV